ncbi:MAG: hypothetical protein DMG30_24680 [Acidobacteria bacterium]|nr:MAG: hypothetical protein DMG30_24680 [Acidobacteriota bacterium]
MDPADFPFVEKPEDGAHAASGSAWRIFRALLAPGVLILIAALVRVAAGSGLGSRPQTLAPRPET